MLSSLPEISGISAS